MDIVAVVVVADLAKKRLAAVVRGEVRAIGKRAAVALPFNTDARAIDALAKKLGATLTVVEVEVETGMRCEDLSASAYVTPKRENERDVTDEATEIFEGWEIDGAFDEEQVALAIAWALIERV